MRTVLTSLLAVVLALAGAAAARAGTYVVKACNAPGGGGLEVAWHLEFTHGAGDFSSSGATHCPTSNGSALATRTTVRTAVRGERAAWTFRAPAGDAVTHVTVWREAHARAGWEFAARAGGAITGGRVLEHCMGTASAFCTRGSPGFSIRSRAFFSLSAPVVSWGLECAAASCKTANSKHASNATVDLQGAEVTVFDPTPPVLGAGGPLLAPGWRRSGEPVTLVARDASGVRSLSVLVDGVARATRSEPCDFRRRAPCPVTASASLSPGVLADGTHAVTMLATDAAGNVARVDRPVVVDGSPPRAFLLPVSGRRIAVSVSDAVSGVTGGRLLVRDGPRAPWRALPTTLSGGRLTATADRAARGLGIRVQARDGAGNFLDSVVTSLRLWARVSGHRHGHWVRHDRVSVPYGRGVVLSGLLTTTDGAPLARQPLGVVAWQHRTGARPYRVAGAVTDGHGHFSLRLRRGASRKVTVTYAGTSAFLRGVARAAVRVPASSSLHASPSVLFGRGRVRFSGRLGLRGTHVPPGGKLLDLQAFDGGRWRTFATARARGRRGRWHASYVFSGRPGHFRIRARILRESTFPYELGYSRSVVVRVI